MLSDKQAEKLGEKLLDLANIAAGALGFGVFLSDQPFSLRVLIGGIVAYVLFTIAGLKLLRKGE